MTTASVTLLNGSGFFMTHPKTTLYLAIFVSKQQVMYLSCKHQKIVGIPLCVKMPCILQGKLRRIFICLHLKRDFVILVSFFRSNNAKVIYFGHWKVLYNYICCIIILEIISHIIFKMSNPKNILSMSNIT